MDKVTCTNCGSENKTHHKYCFSCGYELPKVVKEVVIDHSIELYHKKRKRRNLLIGIAVAVFVVGSAAIAGRVFLKPFFMGKVYEATVKEVNKNCPVMVDQYTRLDSASFISDKTLQYNYTIISMEMAEINKDTLKKYVAQPLIENVKTAPQLKVFRDLKTTFVYSYRDKNGLAVLKIPVTPDMYQ